MTKTLKELANEYLASEREKWGFSVTTKPGALVASMIESFIDYLTKQGYKVVKEECKHEWTNPDSNCKHSYCVHCRIIKESPQPKKIELKCDCIKVGSLTRMADCPIHNESATNKILRAILDHLNK